MKFNISNAELSALNDITNPEFPKYTSQLINWANQNAQGTRPRIVGQLSDLFPEYQASTYNIDISDWEEWYTEKYPDAIEEATDKIFNQVENLKEAIKPHQRDVCAEGYTCKDFRHERGALSPRLARRRVQGD